MKEMTCSFEDWDNWDGELHDAIKAFVDQHGVTPHIMVASLLTYERIEHTMHHGNVMNDLGEHPDVGEHVPLSGFNGPGYELEFAINPEFMERGQYILVFDEEAEWVEPEA